ncbi:MAG: hypothetical protein IKV15_03370 [Bacteroidaceae bacterium]|nr:hypothetical protein [Bacteroidaceae bacterium]
MVDKLKALFMLLCAVSFTSCLQEDDVEYIFTGKEWHLAGFYQTTDWDNPNMGTPMGDYNSHTDIAAYNLLLLTDGTAVVTLPQGCQLRALWEADGHSKVRTFKFSEWKTVTGDPDKMTDKYGRQMYKQLLDVNYYQGDANYIRLFDDTKKYFMQFGDRAKFNP